MKKIFAFASALLLLAGCRGFLGNDGGSTFTNVFTVSADGSQSKAISYVGGNGDSVDSCRVQIWQKVGSDWKFFDCPAVVKVDGKHYTFEETFVKNQEYQILVWVDKAGFYDFKTSGITSTDDAAAVLKAEKRNLNQTDDLDAFFACKYYKATAPLAGGDATIYAKRPFAQLNVISNDFNKLPADYLPKTVSISYKAPVSFNLLNEALGQGGLGAETDITIASVPVLQCNPADTLNILSMDYIFASTSQSLKNFDYTIHYTEDITADFDNIPLQRNYRTNIIGALVTLPNQFQIIVDPIWTGEKEVNY